MARLVEGLGYRYFWATEGLTPKDLNYEISEGSRSSRRTLDHIYRLSQAVVGASEGKGSENKSGKELSFEELRKETLNNLAKAAKNFRGKTAVELEAMPLKMKSSWKTTTFPLWHVINGQISDAIYHVGQIVTYRRASGNPMDSKVNVFTGRHRE